MDAVADEQNESVEDGGRGSAWSLRKRGVGGVEQGNRAAACLVALIISRQRNDMILLS